MEKMRYLGYKHSLNRASRELCDVLHKEREKPLGDELATINVKEYTF
jgi:hypothetical protein